MKHVIAVLFLMAACATASGAELRLMDIPQNELIGSSDLIAVGSVTDVWHVTNAPTFMSSQARLKIERIIKGDATGTVTIMAMGPQFEPGQRRLYFLRKSPGGYMTTHGFGYIRAESEADDFSRRVAAFPISVSLVPPVGPIPPGQAVRLTAIVHNRSAVEIPGYSVSAESYFLRPGDYDDSAKPPLLIPPLAAAPRPQPIPAGAERAVIVDVMGQWPSTLEMAALDPKLAVPIAVRVVVYVSPKAPSMSVDGMLRMISIASPWTNTVVGALQPAR